MDDDAELEIRCLIADDYVCPYRVQLRDNFGYVHLPVECQYRKILKLEFEHRELKRFHIKYEEDFPDG